MDNKLKEKLDYFIKKLREIFGERLKSCILYGSCVKGTYREGISDINLIVIVDSLKYDDLENLKIKLSKFALKNLINAIYFSEWFFLSSSDVFPVEWQDIKENHIIIYGEDLAEKLNINKENLRIELERKIKQLFLDFQREIIFERDKVSLIKETLKNLKFLIPLIERQIGKRISLDEFDEEKTKFRKGEIRNFVDKILSFFSEIIFLIDTDLKGRQK